MYLVVYAPNGIDNYTVPEETYCEESLPEAIDRARRLIEFYGINGDGFNLVKVFCEVPLSVSISVEAL